MKSKVRKAYGERRVPWLRNVRPEGKINRFAWEGTHETPYRMAGETRGRLTKVWKSRRTSATSVSSHNEQCCFTKTQSIRAEFCYGEYSFGNRKVSCVVRPFRHVCRTPYSGRGRQKSGR